LKGKAAVITGASKELGGAISKGVNAVGASVVVNYFSCNERADNISA
jgi:NAD(P)-dependent dehydrogenase (short-subunit alcohol dehydrogenase family)